MTEKDKLSIKFQFHDRKFEVFAFSDETIINLKTIIKNSLLKRVNLKKYGYNTIDIIENNMVINKDTQPVRILREYDDRQLNSVGILDNEELVITFNILNQPDKFGENDKDFKENETDITQYSVYCKKIPGDNSCLFNAINYALNQCLTEAQILRELIAVEIKQNPQIYNEAVLETNPLDYCDWIMRSDSWGGGIELSILSKYFHIRIDVIDIMNNTIEIIGDVRINIFYNI